VQEYVLPLNVTATTSMAEAISGAQYAIHAVPVQHSRVFLESVKVSLSPIAEMLITGLYSWEAWARWRPSTGRRSWLRMSRRQSGTTRTVAGRANLAEV
jgi:hypothetical protein